MRKPHMERLNAAITLCNAKGAREAHETARKNQEGTGAWPEPQGRLLLRSEHAHLAGEIVCTWSLLQVGRGRGRP